MTEPAKKKYKRKFRALREAHDALVEWAEWVRRYMEGSILDYPKNTVEARMRDGTAFVQSGIPGPRVPRVMMPPRIARTDRSVREMPKDLRVALYYKYFAFGTEAQKLQQYRDETGGSGTRYYDQLDLAFAWVAGGNVNNL